MLEEIKIFLNITNNDKNDLLNFLILEAKEFVKSKIGEFEKPTEDIVKEIFVKNKKYFLAGNNVEITKIEKNTGNFENPSWKEFEKGRFLNGCLYLPFNGEIRVSYSVGYETIPNDIKTALNLYIKERFSFENGKIKREVVDGDSVEFELDYYVKNTIESLLAKYKKYDFFA